MPTSDAVSTTWKKAIDGGIARQITAAGITGNIGQGGNKQGGGCWKQGRPCPHEPQEQQGKGCHPDQARTVKQESKETPFCYWNQDALSHWLGPENLGWALVDWIRTRVLLDNGTQVNSVTPAYVHRHKLKVGSIEALDPSMNPYGR